MDASQGTPAVPYVMYYTPKGRIITKQLVYQGVRLCNPAALDMPCVPQTLVFDDRNTRGYPALTNGMHIQVYGYVDENRFVVDRLTVLP
jgi:hypothetical protein